jgi:hypothetical protein
VFGTAPAVVAGATRCGVCCLPFVKPRIVRRISAIGDMPVESLFHRAAAASDIQSTPRADLDDHDLSDRPQ